MKRMIFLLVGASMGMLLTIGCGGENNVLSSGGDQFNVRYEVRFLSEGAVKINHKDSNGVEITEVPQRRIGKKNTLLKIVSMLRLKWRLPKLRRPAQLQLN